MTLSSRLLLLIYSLFQSTQPSQAVTGTPGRYNPLSHLFQSTQPSQAVTGLGIVFIDSIVISIHTALAGCDDVIDLEAVRQTKFQSTQPSQAVTPVIQVINTILEFQSTQPSQAVTIAVHLFRLKRIISIHTALAGCDPSGMSQILFLPEFQSTQPSQAVTLLIN